jgi:hypothetical protein
MNYHWVVKNYVHYVVSDEGRIYCSLVENDDGICISDNLRFIDIKSAIADREAVYHFGLNAHGNSDTPTKGMS